MKEQVEIVMATYNGEKYIKEQLDSLLSQSHPWWMYVMTALRMTRFRL